MVEASTAPTVEGRPIVVQVFIHLTVIYGVTYGGCWVLIYSPFPLPTRSYRKHLTSEWKH